jgi:hypothetical protein
MNIPHDLRNVAQVLCLSLTRLVGHASETPADDADLPAALHEMAEDLREQAAKLDKIAAELRQRKVLAA